MTECSIPERGWAKLLQSLSSCKQLSLLYLWGKSIGEAGRYLTQSIKSWGDEPPLKCLHLSYCSIPERGWAALLQSLSSCKHLSYLFLSNNTIGKAGHHLAKSIKLWGDNPLLEKLDMNQCSIPVQVWADLFQSLHSCKQLSCLDLCHNTIGEAGKYLAQSLTSWGNNTQLKYLYLCDCSTTEQVWTHLFQSLSSCKLLSELDLGENALTGCLSSFLSDPSHDLSRLKRLYLEHTSMNKTDIKHLNQIIQSNRLPHLKELPLKEESWAASEDELVQLKKACQEKIGLVLKFDNWEVNAGEKKNEQVQ